MRNALGGRGLAVFLVLLPAAACPRVTVPETGSPKDPAIQLAGVQLKTARPEAQCAGASTALAGYAGDTLVVTAREGAGWETDSVQVLAGGKPLARTGDATETTVEVALPDVLPPGSLVVSSAQRRSATLDRPVCVQPVAVTALVAVNPHDGLVCPPVDGGGPSLAVFANELVSITGSAWNPALVSVRAGSVPLAFDGTPTATELRVRVPDFLPPTALVVQSGAQQVPVSPPVCVAQPRLLAVVADTPRPGLSCPGNSRAVAAFAGDTLILTGEGWNPDLASVRAGAVTLEFVERPSLTALRVRLPDVLPLSPLVVVSGPQQSLAEPDSELTACVVGPGHPARLAYQGTVETRLTISQAGVAPALPPGCTPAGVTELVAAECARSQPAVTLATTFTLGALTAYGARVFTSLISFDDQMGGTRIAPLPPAAGAVQVRDVRPVAPLPQAAGTLSVATVDRGLAWGPGETPVTRVLRDGEVVTQGEHLEPLVLPGPRGTLVTADHRVGSARIRMHGTGPEPEQEVDVPGRLAALGILDPGFQWTADPDAGSSARLVSLSCTPDTVLTRMQDLTPDGGIRVVRAARVPACDSTSAAGAACEAVKSCTGEDCPLDTLLQCARAADQGPEDGAPTGCTQVLDCHADRRDGGCSQQFNDLMACTDDPGCSALLGCAVGRDGGPDSCPPQDAGTFRQFCEYYPVCARALTCLDDTDAGCSALARCAAERSCSAFACASSACLSAVECLRTAPPACRTLVECQLQETLGQGTCEDTLGCQEDLCRSTTVQELVPSAQESMLLLPRPEPSLLGESVARTDRVCSLNGYSGTVSGFALADHSALAVLPASGGDPVALMATTSLNQGRTLLVLSGDTQTQYTTRTAYKFLLPEPNGWVVFGVPIFGARTDLLSRSGALLGSVSLLGPLLGALLLSGPGQRMALLHTQLLLLQDSSGLADQAAVTPLEVDTAAEDFALPALERSTAGEPVRLWRGLVEGHGRGQVYRLQTVDLQDAPDAFGRTATGGFSQEWFRPLLRAGDQLVCQRQRLREDAATEPGRYLAVTDATVADPSAELVFTEIVGSDGLTPVAYVPGSQRLMLVNAANPQGLHVLDLVPGAPLEVPADALQAGLFLQALPDGTVVGFFFSETLLRVEVGALWPDLSYHSLGELPAPPTAMAVSPDGARMYVAEQGAIVELELVRSPAGLTGARVMGRVGVEGTPSMLDLDAAGNRLLYVDQAESVVGLLE